MNVSSKLSRKNQAEEEFQLIKGLANSINERYSKKPKLGERKDNALKMFGCYVTETLTTLEPKIKHLAQHHINNILFQAQMGSLGEANTAIGQAHTQHYHRPNSMPISNVAPSTFESNLSQFHTNNWLTNQSVPDFVTRRSPVEGEN